jgi:hypothetical protein
MLLLGNLSCLDQRLNLIWQTTYSDVEVNEKNQQKSADLIY